jgi:Immunoglobulin-like domain of bacterial spore germination
VMAKLCAPVLAVAVLASALLIAPDAGSRATVLTAVQVRAGLHPAFARAVVDFAGGGISFNTVEAADPNPFDGSARLELRAAGARTLAAPVAAHGLTLRVTRSRPGLLVRITAPRARFKYLSYLVLHGPERLAIDLWTAARPPAARFGRRGCLTLTSFTVAATSASVAGRERDLFEHSHVVRLRGARGGLVASRPVTSAGGRWSTRLAFRAPRQAGTLEAASFSAKDGVLDCLVQVPVTLGA